MRLREHRAQPAFQRAAAAIIGKLRDSRALAIISAIKVGIDRAREFASFGVFARDAECCVMQLLPIAEHEVFPGLLVSSSAGTGKGKLIHAKAEIEISNRSEEHTSELQSRGHLVCRLLLEKKK